MKRRGFTKPAFGKAMDVAYYGSGYYPAGNGLLNRYWHEVSDTDYDMWALE